MDTCRSCGARLAPDVGWCGQCYTPVAAPAPPASFVLTRRPGMALPPRGPAPAPHYSRLKAGATSMGWVGRSLTTLGVLAAAAFLYLYVFPVAVGINDYRTRTLYLAIASPVILFVLGRVWRPSRIR